MRFLRGLIFIFIFSLTACSGGGKCDTSNTPIGNLNLMLTAPNQYPAGIATTAYLMLTNTSKVDANNLYFEIPEATNYTGVTISVDNINNPCKNIKSGTSCTFSVSIPAGSHPGSFTINAIPNGLKSQSNKIIKSVEEIFNKQDSNVLSITTNIGLTDMPINNDSGANGISFLYSKTVPSTESGDIPVIVVAVVNSANAGTFNTINLTNMNGGALDFEVLSGNSGSNLTNLVQGSVVTFLLKLPHGTTNYQFYAQTVLNGNTIDLSTTANDIGVVESGSGILVVQPTNFHLSSKTGYTSQKVTFTNTGTGDISGLDISFSATGPYTLKDNTCSSVLKASQFCTVVVDSSIDIDVSGSASLSGSYVGGITTSQFTYEGLDPEFGVTLSAVNNFDFNSNTINTTDATVVTLTNTGNVAVNDFKLTFGETLSSLFSISLYDGESACTNISNNMIGETLQPHTSCKFIMTYTNSNVGTGYGDLNISYNYNGETKDGTSTTINYNTEPALAVLQVAPSSYTYSQIVANNQDVVAHTFTVTNNGANSATISKIDTLAVPYTIVSDSCIGTTLNVDDSCDIVVQFGPTANVITNQEAILNVEGSNTNPSAIVSATATLNAGARAPNSANFILTNVVLDPAAVRGNGTFESQAFQFESNATNANMILTYQNNGIDSAREFWINTSTLSANYTVESQISTCPVQVGASITIPVNGNCNLVLKLNRSVAGSKNLSLSNILGNWTDEAGNQVSQMLSESFPNNQVYVSVYAKPAVSFSPSSIQVAANGGMANVTATLSGGYNVESFTVGLNTTNTNNELTANTCTVSSQFPTCQLQVVGAESIEYESSIYTLTGMDNPVAGYSNVVNARVYGIWLDYNNNLTANSMPYTPYGTSLVYTRGSAWMTGTLYLGYIQSQDSAISGKVDVRPVVYSRSPDVNSNWDWIESNIGPFTIDKTESISISLLNVTSHIVVATYNDPTDSNKIHIWVGPDTDFPIADPNANGVSPQMAYNPNSIQSLFLMYIDNSNNLVVKSGAINGSDITSWVLYGSNVASNVVNNMSALSMVVYDGKVYVSYQDNTGIHIAVGNGTTWTDVTTGLSSICSTTGTAAKLAANNSMMYILSGCYNNGQNSAIITSSKFNKDNNQWVGNFGYAAQRSNVPYTNLSATITSTQNIGYMAFQDSSDFRLNPYISVYRIFLDTASPSDATLYNIGSSFEAMSPSVPSTTMSLALGRNNEPYLAFDAYNPNDLLYSVNVMGYPYKFR